MREIIFSKMLARGSAPHDWREDRRENEARGREGGKSKTSKLKSIFRKMFICRSVKLTRGVYLPALPSLSLSLCYHLLRSLSLSQCSGSIGRGTFCTDRTILQIHSKVPSEHARQKCCCCASLCSNAPQQCGLGVTRLD